MIVTALDERVFLSLDIAVPLAPRLRSVNDSAITFIPSDSFRFLCRVSSADMTAQPIRGHFPANSRARAPLTVAQAVANGDTRMFQFLVFGELQNEEIADSVCKIQTSQSRTRYHNLLVCPRIG